MEIIAFWSGCIALGLFFHLTSGPQRRQWIRSGWTVLLLAGAAGLLWELAH